MKFCPHCGAKTPSPNLKFCADCGGKLFFDTSMDSPPSVDSPQAPLKISADRIRNAPLKESALDEDDLFQSPFIKDYTARPARHIEDISVSKTSDKASTQTNLSTEPVVDTVPASTKPHTPDAAILLAEELLAESTLKQSVALSAHDEAVVPSNTQRPDTTAPTNVFTPVSARPPLSPKNNSTESLPSSIPAQSPILSESQPSTPPPRRRATSRTAPQPDLFAQEPIHGAAPKQAPPPDLFAQEPMHGAASPEVFTQEIPVASAPVQQARPIQTFAQAKPQTQAQKMPATAITNIPAAASAHKAPVMSRRSQQSDYYDDFDIEPDRRKSGNVVRNVLIGILAGLLVLLLAVLGFLYWQNRPSTVINEFTEALAARDYQSLSETVTATGVTASGAEGWVALCDAFEGEEARAALAQELSRVSADADSSGFLYPSIRLKGEPLFLFIQQYHVRLTGVTVVVPNGTEGTALRLSAGDEFKDFTGVTEANGVVFSGIMPGQYDATVTLPDGTVQQGSVSAFSTTTANNVNFGTDSGTESQTVTYANLTIQNCISDEAQIFVDGQLTPLIPAGGVVQLQQVELGTTISIEATVDGAVQTSSVTFSDPNQTTLAFGEYTQTGPASSSSATTGQTLDETAANAVLTTFYQSYLEAINNQNLDGIQLSTQANNSNLQARITSAANQANTYTFVGATVDPTTLTVEDVNGVPTANFTATCSFNYVARENPGDAQTSRNTQAVRLIYQDGAWLVDSFTNA